MCRPSAMRTSRSRSRPPPPQRLLVYAHNSSAKWRLIRALLAESEHRSAARLAGKILHERNQSRRLTGSVGLFTAMGAHSDCLSSDCPPRDPHSYTDDCPSCGSSLYFVLIAVLMATRAALRRMSRSAGRQCAQKSPWNAAKILRSRRSIIAVTQPSSQSHRRIALRILFFSSPLLSLLQIGGISDGTDNDGQE
jgi:hypothetical protein